MLWKRQSRKFLLLKMIQTKKLVFQRKNKLLKNGRLIMKFQRQGKFLLAGIGHFGSKRNERLCVFDM